MTINRRCFVRAALAAPLLVISAPPPRARAAAGSAGSGPMRSGTFSQTAPDFGHGTLQGAQIAGEGRGALRLGAGSADGTYVSPPLLAPYPFDAVGLTWRADIPAGASLDFALRVSADAVAWSDWTPIVESADLPAEAPEHVGSLLMAGGRVIQWSVRLRAADDGAAPELKEVRVIYIDAAPDLAVDRAPLAPAHAAATGVAAPTIVSRAGWGCPQPTSSPDWPPEYETVQKIVVHHTATTNSYTDGAAQVRIVWRYHAVSLDWGDIGYNYLIDRYGTIYEGRYGGDDVVAGHALCYNRGSIGVSLIGNFAQAAVPSAAQDALVRLLAWLAYRRNLDPLGHSFFKDRDLGNICAHRDLNSNTSNANCYMATECPGTYLYSLVSPGGAIQQRTWSAYPQYGAEWTANGTPSSLFAGQTVSVSLTVANRGRLTWPADGANPVHIGYHWYRQDGSQYVQNAADDHRTACAAAVAYDGQATVQAQLTAPAEAGSYTLKWDLVQEGVTWFASQGVDTANAPVTINAALAADRSSLGFEAEAATDPASQAVRISAAGSQGLAWTAAVSPAASQSWCRLSATSGQTPATLIVSIDKSALTPGAVYHAQVTVTSIQAPQSPATIDVNLFYSARPLRHGYLPLTER